MLLFNKMINKFNSLIILQPIIIKEQNQIVYITEEVLFNKSQILNYLYNNSLLKLLMGCLINTSKIVILIKLIFKSNNISQFQVIEKLQARLLFCIHKKNKMLIIHLSNHNNNQLLRNQQRKNIWNSKFFIMIYLKDIIN